MITKEEISSLEKEQIAQAAMELETNDLPQLVEWLSEKDDKLRYQAFLLLQFRSQKAADVYPFFTVFHQKTKNSNSYQRSLGAMLLAANTRWDNLDLLDAAIDDYLLLLQDEKPITVRQCIQSLCEIIPYKQKLCAKISSALCAIPLASFKETMQKSILLDILSMLIFINRYQASNEIESYLEKALSGSLLDKKAKKQIELLKNSGHNILV